MSSVWDDIKDRLSVEEVIADYIPLVNAGANYKAVCPFHQEKSPSLMISPSKGIWHCFGCGEGGDIFAFVSQIEGIEKQEVLRRLAKKAGVDLAVYQSEWKRERGITDSGQTSDGDSGGMRDATTSSTQQSTTTTKHQQGLQLLAWTADIYHKILLKILQDYTHPVTQYCRERRLTQETLDTFMIGYAPRSNTILQLAHKYGLSTDILIETGILKTTEKNGASQITDKFKDRLMIPIQSRDGDTVGFTARVLPHDTYDRPKYLNSSQSQWFNKSDLWFGANHARSAIIRQKNAIIVEGNMDVICCHQAGLTTAIASQGTSFTDTQLQILKRMTRHVSLAFDNDEAGVLAGKKFFIQATEQGITVDRVVIPSEYKDIDEYISTRQQNIQSAQSPQTQTLDIEVVPYFQWYVTVVRPKLVSSDMNIQRHAIEDCVEIIAVMDILAQDQSIKLLAEMTGLLPSTLHNLVDSERSKRAKEQKRSSTFSARIESDATQPSMPSTIAAEMLTSRHKYQSLINRWKNYYALAMNDVASRDIQVQLYELLQELFPSIGTHETLDEYHKAHKEELDYIASELDTQDSLLLARAQSQLLLELDREVYIAPLHPDIMDRYIRIKTLLHV